MQGCDVCAVDLSSANLVDTNLTRCSFDDGTKFPEGYTVPNGAMKVQKLPEVDWERIIMILLMAIFLIGLLALAIKR
jgi:hypothetical protein